MSSVFDFNMPEPEKFLSWQSDNGQSLEKRLNWSSTPYATAMTWLLNPFHLGYTASIAGV